MVTKKTTEKNQKKGILNFLFSFQGAISRELFIPIYTILAVIILFMANMVYKIEAMQEPSGFLLFSFSIIYLTIMYMLFAALYKRAHALGISGVYSITGLSLFMPFFMFCEPEKDLSNDDAYKNKFTSLKKIGSFIVRNLKTKFLYLFALYGICFINYTILPMSTEVQISKVLTFILIIFTILSLLQMFIKKTSPLYTNIVKVVSFIALILLVAFISFNLGSVYMLITIMEQMQMGAMAMPM